VDGWARETRSTVSAEVNGDDGDGEGDSDVVEQGENTGADPSLCANNWKAAQSDSKEWMWGVFAETGLFASACRHGLILWVADMIRSGEQ